MLTSVEVTHSSNHTTYCYHLTQYSKLFCHSHFKGPFVKFYFFINRIVIRIYIHYDKNIYTMRRRDTFREMNGHIPGIEYADGTFSGTETTFL